MDKTTRLLTVNESEAAAVRMIFSMYLEGYGYGAIIDELNSRGFRTKRGRRFSKNSLHEILRNEKYTGVYIYNKSAAKDPDGKYNRHAYKSDDEIIRIEGAVPKIIDEADFDRVQRKMIERRHKAASFTAKEQYLLSGKIVCGECNSSYVGNSQRATIDHPQYISYRCAKRNGAIKCDNTGIRRDDIEGAIMNYLCDRLFNEELLPELMVSYESFIRTKSTKDISERDRLMDELKRVERGIENIVGIIVDTGSGALTEKLKELEKEKAGILLKLNTLNAAIPEINVSPKRVAAAFQKGKKLLMSNNAGNARKIIEQYVESVVVYRDTVECSFNPLPHMTCKNTFMREELKAIPGGFSDSRRCGCS